MSQKTWSKRQWRNSFNGWGPWRKRMSISWWDGAKMCITNMCGEEKMMVSSSDLWKNDLVDSIYSTGKTRKKTFPIQFLLRKRRYLKVIWRNSHKNLLGPYSQIEDSQSRNRVKYPASSSQWWSVWVGFSQQCPSSIFWNEPTVLISGNK